MTVASINSRNHIPIMILKLGNSSLNICTECSILTWLHQSLPHPKPPSLPHTLSDGGETTRCTAAVSGRSLFSEEELKNNTQYSVNKNSIFKLPQGFSNNRSAENL